MAEDELTPGLKAEIAQQIATLRGLYGDLGDTLNDADARRQLWDQIRDEQDRLDALLGSSSDLAL